LKIKRHGVFSFGRGAVVELKRQKFPCENRIERQKFLERERERERERKRERLLIEEKRREET